jgi:hypothetical protein
MSRVLRRPMFRGGIADSEGTGITSGLTDNYKEGGRVGFANGSSLPPEGYFDIILREIIPSYLQKFGSSIVDPEKLYKKRIAEIEKQTGDIGYMYDPSGLTPIVPGRTKTIDELNLFTEKGKSSFIEDLQKQRKKQIKEITESSKNLSEEQKNKLFSYYGITKKDISETTSPPPPPPPPLKEKEVSRKQDFKTIYEDLLPLFQKELGAAEDEFSRQKYLELAKFGLNLLRQPGGPAGGKRDLLGAIAASAEKPLEGYQAILAKEKQAQRLPKALALEAAMKEAEPGSIGKAVKDLKRLGIPENKAIEIATQTGSATKEQTYEAVIRNIQEGLVKNGIVTDDYAARATAQELLTAERQGVPFSLFERFPANPIEGDYYIMKNGQSGRYYQGKLLKPGEKGFTGPLSK